MRKAAKRIVAGLAGAALTTSLVVAPAAADEPVQSPDTGLVFYRTNPTLVVGRQATPDGLCHPLPANATWYLVWSGGFQLVTLYEGADCTGNSTTSPPFRQFRPGPWASYTTS